MATSSDVSHLPVDELVAKRRREREARRAKRIAEAAGAPGRRNQEVDFVPGQEWWRHRDQG